MDHLLLTAPEVGRLLGVCTATVRDVIAAQELPAVRIRRCVRIPVGDLHAWIKRQTSGSHATKGGERDA
jgi:excisionase family DNA binding protein